MRWTPQRRTIVDVLASASGHLTGPELIERCRTADPTTIPSTVYRTLDVLEELGLVRHGHSADGREEFHVAQEPEHGHLYCATCGGRWEVGSAQAHAIMADPTSQRHRRLLVHHQVFALLHRLRVRRVRKVMLQVGLATLLGGAIGLERELGGKPAGLRTNILICIGSVLYTHLSIAMLSAIAGSGGTGTDPTRVAGQIVTGVGFIGAGTILHARGAVVGLTSAATIWVVAAIGVALGSGYYLEGIGTTVVVLAVLAGLGRVEKLVERQSMRSTITVHAHPGPTVLEDLEGLVRRAGLEVSAVASRQENVDLVIDFDLRGSKRLHDQLMITLLHHDHVRTVSTGE